MRKKSTFLALCVCILFSLPSLAQNQAFILNDTTYIKSSVDVISSGDFTIEFWVYVDISGMDGQRHQFVSQGATDGVFGFYIGYDGTDGNILLGDFWNGGTGNPTGITMPTNQWTHIAVTHNGSSLTTTLYLNGVPRTTASLFWSQFEKFRIGAQTTETEFAVATKIDELKSWTTERSAFTVKQDMFGIPDPNDPTLEAWYDFTNNATLTLQNMATGPNTGSTQDGVIISADTTGHWTSSPIQAGTNGLTFDGSENDQVVIPDSAAYDQIFNHQTGKGGTIEFWIKPASLSGTFSTILGKYGHYSFLLSSSQIGIFNGATTNTIMLPTDGDFASGYPTTDWSHLAFVYDGADRTAVYYNGLILDTIRGPIGDNVVANQPISLGISKSLDNNTDDSLSFTGGIDEVRIWRSQKSDADILYNMNNSLSGVDDSLISQFTFDQGVPGQDNTGMTVAFDNVAGNHGMLSNFQLTGASSNFTFHQLTVIPVPLPITLTKFTALRSGSQGLLQWQTAQEQNSRDFTIERSTDGGRTYTSIGVVRAAGNSTLPRDYTFTDLTPEKTSNYYRLRESDLDGKYTYSPVKVLNFGTQGRLGWYTIGKLSAGIYLQQGNSENYTLTDASGHTLRQGQLAAGKAVISNLPAGVYFVRVFTSSGNILNARILLL
jgi:hypothetical protein